MTCAQMGGPENCNFIVTGKTAEEMVKNGMSHLTEAHPEMAGKMKNNSAAENERWMSEFRPKFEAAESV